MTLKWQLLGFILALGIAVPKASAQNSTADTELNLGIAAYGTAKYNVAIDHLERAVILNPESVTGHFYLAGSYEATYSEECDWDCDANEWRRVRSVEEYKKVLELEPSNIKAMKALAWRYYRSARSGDADSLYREVLQVDPNDFEALYTLAVIQWQRSYQFRSLRRAELKLGPNETLIDLPSCSEIRSRNLTQVEEGISLLTQAVDNVGSYDVKEYLSLLYRERAEIQCGDRSAYDQDVNTAIDWASRACEARHKPDHVPTPCGSLRCVPSPPPPPERGQPGGCSD